MITRRALLGSTIVAIASGGNSNAQSAFPSRPIQMLVPFAAGGSTDTIARPLAFEIGKAVGGDVFIENRGGAGGAIAIDYVAHASPDGHTLLLGSIGPLTVTQFLTKTWKTDPGKALTPIGMIADAPLVVVVGRKGGITSFQQLVEKARRNPDQLTYASSSVGSSNHLAGILLDKLAGTMTRHVPYRGAAPAMTDLLGGQVDFMVAAVPSARGLIESGDLIPLAITGETRSPLFPTVPTANEAGLDGYIVTTWYGLCAPLGLPAPVQARIANALESAMGNETLLNRIRDEGASPSRIRGDAFGAFMTGERKKWGALIADAGIEL